MTTKEKMMLENKAWVLEKQGLDHKYFEQFTNLSKPGILWIDSVDNLVPIKELTNTEPGEIIVHRNLASQVKTDDTSLMASIEYAVDVYAVEFIIVSGCSQCTGIRQVVRGVDGTAYTQKWLDDLVNLYNDNFELLDAHGAGEKEKRLCELNIREQVINLSKLDVIQRAWDKGSTPILLGWYFDLQDGHIKEIFSMTADERKNEVVGLVE